MIVVVERLPEGHPDRERGFRWLLSYEGFDADQQATRSWTSRKYEHAVSGAKALAVQFLCDAWVFASGLKQRVFEPTPAAIADFNRDPARHLVWLRLQERKPLNPAPVGEAMAVESGEENPW